MKKIIIEDNGSGIALTNEGFSNFELIGVFRFFEKGVLAELNKDNRKENNLSEIPINERCCCLEPTISTAVGVCGKCGLNSGILLNSGKL